MSEKAEFICVFSVCCIPRIPAPMCSVRASRMEDKQGTTDSLHTSSASLQMCAGMTQKAEDLKLFSCSCSSRASDETVGSYVAVIKVMYLYVTSDFLLQEVVRGHDLVQIRSDESLSGCCCLTTLLPLSLQRCSQLFQHQSVGSLHRLHTGIQNITELWQTKQ